MLKFIDLEIVS